MDPGQDDLRAEIAELRQRVARLETALAQQRVGVVTESTPVQASASAAVRGESTESLEARIGSRIFNRIGIVAVLIGVAWFLKIAFDNRWLGAAGKVSAGIVAGLGLIGWSEWFHHHAYDAFSYSLKAVGAGLLYLSLWAAWSLFHLFSLPEAAATMVLVTAGIGLLAWTRDSELLALYAAVGGYLTPLLLSDGRNHEAELFAYLLLLGVAAVALVAARPWPRLALGAFLATAGYAMGWFALYYTETQFGLTLGFAVAFLLLFALVQFVRVPFVAGASQAASSRIPLVVPVLNAAFAFVGTIFLFERDARGWACLALCGFYCALSALSRAARSHVLIANCFLLAAVSFGIDSYWATSADVDRGLDEQIGYSAWFMVFGAAVLAAGFWRRSAALRWQGLIVLCIAIAKVFLVDMQTLSQGYRVLSFLGLGALLLGVSFVYQKDWLSLRGRT